MLVTVRESRKGKRTWGAYSVPFRTHALESSRHPPIGVSGAYPGGSFMRRREGDAFAYENHPNRVTRWNGFSLTS
jgi:hypothetical protein